MAIKIKNELEMKRWFEKNFEKLGYSKIIRKDNGEFPDFIMLRNNKVTKVELETLSSNFILHNHDYNKVDEVVCLKKDVSLNLPVIEIKDLEFLGGKRRISATVDKETVNLISVLLKNSNYRNKSHLIEEAIREMAKGMK